MSSPSAMPITIIRRIDISVGYFFTCIDHAAHPTYYFPGVLFAPMVLFRTGVSEYVPGMVPLVLSRSEYRGEMRSSWRLFMPPGTTWSVVCLRFVFSPAPPLPLRCGVLAVWRRGAWLALRGVAALGRRLAAVLRAGTGLCGGEGVVVIVVVISVDITVLTVVVPGLTVSRTGTDFLIGIVFWIGAKSWATASPNRAESTMGDLFSTGAAFFFWAVPSFFSKPAIVDGALALFGVQKASAISLSFGEASNPGGEGVISIGSSLFMYTGGLIVLATISGVTCDGEIQVFGVRGAKGVGGVPPVWNSGVVISVSSVLHSGVVTLGEAISVSSFLSVIKDTDLRRLGWSGLWGVCGRTSWGSQALWFGAGVSFKSVPGSRKSRRTTGVALNPWWVPEERTTMAGVEPRGLNSRDAGDLSRDDGDWSSRTWVAGVWGGGIRDAGVWGNGNAADLVFWFWVSPTPSPIRGGAIVVMKLSWSREAALASQSRIAALVVWIWLSRASSSVIRRGGDNAL